MFTFPKKEHLSSRKKINETLTKGVVVFYHPFKLYYQLSDKESTTEPVQFAVSVPKRNFKKAVDRNRIKRLIRESYRLNKHEIIPSIDEKPFGLSLFLIYIDKNKPSFIYTETKIKLLLHQLIISINRNKLS